MVSIKSKEWNTGFHESSCVPATVKYFLVFLKMKGTKNQDN